MRRARFVETGFIGAARLALFVLAGWPALLAGTAAADDKFAAFPNVTYVERDGLSLQADVWVPQGEGPFPAVLVVHGGAWTAGNKATMVRVAAALAERGYVACAINYRLAPKYPFPAQIEDCKSAIRWLRTNADKYKIDQDRIGGFGYSAGGHLVALLGTTDTESGLEGSDVPAGGPSTRIQAVVAGGAPCDFREFPPNNLRLSYWLGGSRADKPQAYELASPARFISKDDPPTFFFHGEADALVPLASPRAMQAQLSTAGVPSDLFTVPKAGHIEAFRDPAATQAGIDFLDKHLKKRQKDEG